ncbi:MAG: molybdate ABC transporter substrate-binding protein [Acidobacteria bacterium]|nr:molybdate ABC transporter substrate-binding protein [Acidobacteriota bacterium]
MMTIIRIILTAMLWLVFLGRAGMAQEIRVAAAADLQSAFDVLGEQFKRNSGISVKLAYGSSGDFFHQLESGAPFDMFFSANLDYAKALEADGHALPESYYEYARGKIVLWSRKEVRVELGSGLHGLLDSSIKRVAIANPQHAPYGQAAVAALKKENIYESVERKLVIAENVSQAASFVLSGAADAGIIALSLAKSPHMRDQGYYAEIPTADYQPLVQACVVLRSSRNQEAATQFLTFLKTPAAAQLLRSYGFEIP